MKRSPKCPVCKTKMNVYWYNDQRNMMTPYVRINTTVIGIANCPKCYHLEDVTEEGIDGKS